MLKITVPLFVMLPRKTKPAKKIILNLNNYPHWHYMIYNQAKVIFCDALANVLKNIVLKTPVEIHYTLFKKTQRKSDRMNVLAVIDKFFCDSLTYYGCLPDDTDEYILGQTFTTGGIDKNNPRVEIEINEK